MATRMQQRRGTAAQWTTANPILAAGEIGFETDNNKFKIGDGVNHWADLSYFSDAASISALVDGAPALMDTLNEISAALGDDPDFVNTIGQQISTINNSLTYLANIEAVEEVINTVETHIDSTENVHGIVNTADLVNQTQLSTAISNLSDDLQGTLDDVSSSLTDHEALQTSVHGITNTQNLVYTADSRLSDERTPVDGSVTTAKIVNDAVKTAKIEDGAVTANKLASDSVTNSKIANDAVDTAEIKNGAVTNDKLAGSIAQSKVTNLESNLSSKQDKVTNVSDTEIGYLDGVTSAIQTQLNAKAPSADPTFTGTVILPSTTSIGNVSATEIGYVDGVTSAIQTQIDAKLSKSGGTMTGDLTLAGAPSADLHAATKAYVDNIVSGINFHQPVRVATTANITLSGTQTIDGVSLSVDDRVLVKDQTDQKTNGIYVVSSSTWSRATDADNTPGGELAGGDFCLVLEGTVGSGYGYVCSNTSAITIGSSNITYVAYNAAKAITAGSGLTESTPGTLDIATGGVTSAMIADGTIVNGDISASAAIAQSKISGLTSDLAAKAPLASPTFTGTVTVAASGIAFTDGTQTKEGVPSRTPIIQKSASYTLSALTERDSLIEVASSSGTTITIPTDLAVAFPIGTTLDILQTSSGQVTIAGDSGVTVNATPGLKLRTQWSSATLLKRASNTWVVFGDLSA